MEVGPSWEPPRKISSCWSAVYVAASISWAVPSYIQARWGHARRLFQVGKLEFGFSRQL